MKILLIADVHNKPNGSKSTIKKLKKVIANTQNDLIVFLGDTVHCPAVNDGQYETYLRQVLDLTNGKSFAYIFGNHDNEGDITKEEILSIVNSYSNSVTKGCNYVVEMMGETLLFIDSGSYYNGEGSYYDVVSTDTINWAKNEISGKQAILFQHIIMPDIIHCLNEYNHFMPFCVTGDGKWVKFKKGVKHTGFLGERPCPPDINNGELEQLSPNLKCAVFGHDHKNDFELTIMGTKFIQCAGCGRNSYDKYFPSSVKILDTKTLQTKKIYL